MYQLLIVLALAGSAAAADCLACKQDTGLLAAMEGPTESVWVLATPDASSMQKRETSKGASVFTAKFRDVVFLNQPAAAQPVKLSEIEVHASRDWSPCGFSESAMPLKNEKRRIFQLQKGALVAVEPVADVVTPAAPQVTVPEQPRGSQDCGYKPEYSSETGFCTKQADCAVTDSAGNMPYSWEPWSKGNGNVNSGCKNLNHDWRCCLPAKGYTAPQQPELQPAQAGQPTSQALQYTIRSCSKTLNTCVGGDNCISEEAARLLLANDKYGLTASDISGLDKFECAGQCQNGGECTHNACVCVHPYVGDNCETRKPFCTGAEGEDSTVCVPKLTFDTIVPGNGNGDTWQVGTQRTISFEVKGFQGVAGQQSAAKVDIYLDTTAGLFKAFGQQCASNTLTKGMLLGTVDLAALSQGREDFTAQFTHTLVGNACLESSSNFRIVLHPVTADGSASDAKLDGTDVTFFSVVRGDPFTVAYTSCVADASGLIGTCKSSAACDTDVETAVASKHCAGAAICCTPRYLNVNSDSQWFTFTTPADDGGSVLVQGSKLRLKWTIAAASFKSKFFGKCDVTDSSTFSLKLFRAGWPDKIAAVSEGPFLPTEGSQGADFEVVSDIDFVAGKKYFFRADFGNGCHFDSRKMKLVVPNCQGHATETILGQCIPASSCQFENNGDASLCEGIAGGATCCHAERTGMSAGFKDGNGGLLDAPASATICSFFVAVAALFVALF